MTGNGRRLLEPERACVIADARRLRRQGQTLRAIAETLDYALSTVGQWCRGAVEPRDWVALRRRAVELRQAGYPVRRIAEELSVSRGAVYQWIADARVSADPEQVGTR